MDFRLSRVQAWSAEIPDRPGGAADVLEPLAKAEANLEFIWTRRLDQSPGRGVIYVAPVSGPVQTRAAQQAGFHKDDGLILLRITGSDRPGVGHSLVAGLARAGINLRGASMTAIDGRFVAYIACDSPDDAARAVEALVNLQL